MIFFFKKIVLITICGPLKYQLTSFRGNQVEGSLFIYLLLNYNINLI